MLVKESSERSDNNNWVKNKLLSTFNIAEFEGYTIMHDNVSALLDRRLIKDVESFNHNDVDSVARYIIEVESEKNLQAKLLFAHSLNCKYSYILYSYKPEKVFIYTVESPYKVKLAKSYNRILDFALDLSTKRDQWMSSNYEEDSLPVFDKLLRSYNLIGILSSKLRISENNKTKPSQKYLQDIIRNFSNKTTNIVNSSGKLAWPGNLDGLVYDINGKPRVLIEFSTVKKGRVKDHCHNDFFLPSSRRKGDEKRWKVFDVLSKSSGLPHIIILWSPYEVNEDIQYKIIDRIVYSDNMTDETPGLKYAIKETINYEQLEQRLNSFLL